MIRQKHDETTRRLTRNHNQRRQTKNSSKNTADATRPPAVVMRASEIFSANSSGSVPPGTPIVSKARVIPKAVPASPNSGGIPIRNADPIMNFIQRFVCFSRWMYSGSSIAVVISPLKRIGIRAPKKSNSHVFAITLPPLTTARALPIVPA